VIAVAPAVAVIVGTTAGVDVKRALETPLA
jgi:hypothetical protein